MVLARISIRSILGTESRQVLDLASGDIARHPSSLAFDTGQLRCEARRYIGKSICLRSISDELHLVVWPWRSLAGERLGSGCPAQAFFSYASLRAFLRVCCADPVGGLLIHPHL